MNSKSVDLHSLCYAHPIPAMKGSVAGRTKFAFELLKHRSSDPLREELERRGVILSEHEDEDAMATCLYTEHL